MQLNFPEYTFRVSKQANAQLIFDPIRKRWIKLTPEEWVRQHVIAFLVQSKNYPASLLAVERELQFNTRKKRFDMLVFSREGHAFMLIETKAPEVKLNNETLMQICTYNMVFKVPYLFISNGLEHMLYQLNGLGNFEPIQEFPNLPSSL